MNTIRHYASQSEAKMFRDYPELSNEYLGVFYGATYSEIRHEVDADVIDRAKKVLP